MQRRLVPLITILALVSAVSACGDDGGSLFEETPATDGAGSLFEGTAGTVPESMSTITVEVAPDKTWQLPAAVCLRDDGDADIVLAVAQQEDATVHSLVDHQISGWPTTTAQPPEQQEAWVRDLRVAGVTALTLAGLVGEQAALEQAWVDYEQSHAHPEEGWGPPQEISLRIDDWRSEAETLTQAIAVYCAAE